MKSINNTAAEHRPLVEVESFVMTSCHPFRSVASNRPISLLGTLETERPEYLECGGVGVGMSASAMSAPVLESSASFARLQEYLLSHNATGWSVSVWFIPSPSNVSRLESILTLGLRSEALLDAEDNNGSEGLCDGNYLQIARIQSNFMVRFQDSNANCRRFVVGGELLAPDALVQVTVTVGPTNHSIYVNGQAARENTPFVPSIFSWSPGTTLQLFSRHSLDDTTVFQGSILQVSFFDEELTPGQVTEDFERGVLEAPPLTALGLVDEHDPVIIPQDLRERSRFWLGGSRVSSEFLPLTLEVLRTPSRGQVFLEHDQEPLLSPTDENATVVLSLPSNSSGLWLEYEHPRDGSFSVPRVNALGQSLQLLPSDTMEYRIVAKNSTGHVVVESSTATQYFEVQHVNHRPVWIAPKNATVTTVDGDSSVVVEIGAIHLNDAQDFDMNLVRINVVVSRGTVTLNSSYAELADFTSCAQCWGDGTDDQVMTFLALPSQVDLILSGLQYNGFGEGDEDKMVLTAFDGAGGPCLDLNEQQKDQPSGAQLMSIHRECFQEQIEIYIPSIEFPNKTEAPLFIAKTGDKKGSFWLPNLDPRSFGMADILFWVVLFVFLGCCCTCLRICCPNCLARGTAIVPDDYVADDDDSVYGSETDSDTDSESDTSSISSMSEGDFTAESCDVDDSFTSTATGTSKNRRLSAELCELPV